ncbi:MAG: protein-glutamate O-methyltransferase CheR [Kiritimatiellae bacterium]|jgi:chemotaxis protein methyltransferase CheR|nr:protein-glutamate O-methyltransferase CheR [Kiritimatiellia bacterium]
MLIHENQVDNILQIVEDKTGTKLNGYRRHTLFQHICERMGNVTANADEYIAICNSDIHECEQLIHSLSINVSSFFRDPTVFEILAQSIIPGLLNKETVELRVWSAGCAAGEEAYSVAILINEALKSSNDKDTVSMIFATDINHDVLDTAKRALYTRDTLKNTKLGIFDKYFTPEKDEFLLSKNIRKMVYFSVEDLLSDKHTAPAESIYGTFNLILCRNVLIYFSVESQIKVQKNLYNSLATRGILILGHAETLCQELNQKFKIINLEHRIYQKII